MKKFVVMSGGFHPFHAGHASLYQQAKEAFPDAKVLVCATNVQSDRPFPFSLKKKLAQLSGVPPKDFIEVSRQFTIQDPALAQRIGNPDDAIVIYVRSEKDRNEAPQPWKLGPDGKPPVGKKGPKKGLPLSNYLLEYPGEGQPLEPVSKHAYMAYLKTVEFGPGITSASEIRNAWPKLNEKRKLAMVMSLYPTTKSNPQLAQNVVGMFDQVMGEQQDVAEDKESDPITSAVLSFYKPVVNDIHKEKLPDYVDQARELLQKTKDPEVRTKLVDIFKKGKENPYIQGGIVTTIGAVLAGGILTTAQKMGLSPAQTNLALQAILNTVIPTVVSRINGKNWSDTIKYTLASAGIGTGIAGASLVENDPWGDQGNFAGDKPVNIGGATVKQLQVGDIVTYFGQKAKIEAMSKTGNTSRITIINKMGGTTQDVLTRDLKRTGISEENGGVGGGFGTNYPGTYEQENGPFTHKGGLKLTSLTTESVDYLDEK
jgi:hypothetical protein